MTVDELQHAARFKVGPAHEAEARRRLAVARCDLAAADKALQRFGSEQLAVNWRERCWVKVRDAIALCEEMGCSVR